MSRPAHLLGSIGVVGNHQSPLIAPHPTWAISQRSRSSKKVMEERKRKDDLAKAAALTPKIVVAPIPKVRFLRLWNIRERGLHAYDGDRVKLGDVLCRQMLMDFHPGQHVKMGFDRTLYALEKGRMIITSEIIDPDWDNEHIQEAYHGRKGQVIFKKHLHVIPDPPPKKFRLVSLV